MIVCLFHRIDPPDRGRPQPHNGWCVLRAAAIGQYVTSLCCFSFEYRALELLTVDLADQDARLPHNLCPACRTELAAKTPGAAVCVEPAGEYASLESRVSTVDLRPARGRAESVNEWDGNAAPQVAMDDLLSRRLLR